MTKTPVICDTISTRTHWAKRWDMGTGMVVPSSPESILTSPTAATYALWQRDFISGRELNRKWDDSLNPNQSTTNDNGSSTLAIWFMPHSLPWSLLFTCLLPSIRMCPRHLLLATAVSNLFDESSGGRMVKTSNFDRKGYLPCQSLNSSP